MSESGKKKEGATISAELVLDGGVAATATFDAAPGYELNRGMFYDVEVRSKNQDGAFLQVAALPEGKSIGEVADSFFTKTNPNPNPNPNPHPHPNPEPEPNPNPNQVADSFFTKKVFSTEGRFGAYGAPTDIKVLSTNKGA